MKAQDITQRLQAENEFKVKASQVVCDLNRILGENPNEKFRTIWEIFCYQNGVDESNEGIESIVFDGWSHNIKLMKELYPNASI
jgi:hypothetical protein